MDLNNIDLPALLVADLYTSSLIEDDAVITKNNDEPVAATSIVSSKEELSAWKYLGNNQKKILVVSSAKENLHLPDVELNFLTGVLVACKLSLDDVAVFNIHHYPNASYKELTSFFKTKVVLLFAVEPSAFGLPMSFPYYQVQPFAGNSFLYAPSLKDLENDRVEKSKLWVSLKRLFNL